MIKEVLVDHLGSVRSGSFLDLSNCQLLKSDCAYWNSLSVLLPFAFISRPKCALDWCMNAHKQAGDEYRVRYVHGK
jgi:hypothetical protein